MCLMTIVGPPEFDRYAAACYTCPWSGPERWERIEASADAREHQQRRLASPKNERRKRPN